MSSDLASQNVTFIGGGNMAAAIISGLVAAEFSSAKSQIYVSEPWDVNRDKMAGLGVRTTASNVEAAAAATILILAVKPQVAKGVCEELAASFSSSSSQRRGGGGGGGGGGGAAFASLPLVVSICAGISVNSLRAWFTTADGRTPAVVRVMPNTPALLGEGASGVFAGPGVSAEQRVQVTALLGSVSKATEWVDKEELIEVVTGVSGSGPAYFFAMVEHLISAGMKLGLSEEVAMRLASQTCLGAGRMLVEPNAPGAAQLRKNVTSPNGTTQAALESFEASGFAGIVEKAVKAAADRGEELGRTLGAM